MDTDRVLPFSEEAEKGSLGALLLDWMRLGAIVVRMGLTEEAWFVPANRLVAGAILALLDERQVVDMLTVSERLRRLGKLDQVGGWNYLAGLVDACPTATHGEFYLEEVLDLWLLRRQMGLCMEHMNECRAQTEKAQVLVAKGSQRFAELAQEKKTEPTNEERMNESLQVWRDIKDKKRTASGLELPWPSLTTLMCGLEPGLTIVAGRPGAGKSTLEGLMCDHLASQGVPVARVTLDMTGRDLLDRVMCKHAGVSLKKLKAGFAREDQLARMESARDVLAKQPLWINDQDRELKRICGWARGMRLRHGIQLLTVDFIQKVQVAGMGASGYDQTKKVTVVTDVLKALAFELGIPVVALSQLSREGEKAQRDPRLTDLRDSGSIEQDASKVVMLYPERNLVEEMERAERGSSDKKRPVLVDLQKSQNGGQGVLGFWFYCAYFRFDEAPEGFGVSGGTSGGGEERKAEWEM
jgi:replicative DNA helicase